MLLSLFTSPERASEMEGDLLEEKHEQGPAWFVLQVMATTLFLYKERVLQTAITSLFVSILLSELLFLGLWFSATFLPFSHDEVLVFATFSLIYFLVGMLISLAFSHAGATIAFTMAFFNFIIWLGVLLSTSVTNSGNPLAEMNFAVLVYVLLGLGLFVIFTVPMILGSLLVERNRIMAKYRRDVLANYGA